MLFSYEILRTTYGRDESGVKKESNIEVFWTMFEFNLSYSFEDEKMGAKGLSANC